MTARLDAFVDAAFAFAATVLLLGADDLPKHSAAMLDAMEAVPAFLISFATIAMFWYTHVRWRRMREGSDGPAVLLSLALVFLVLVYVIPLRLFAGVTAAYFGLGGAPPSTVAELAQVFRIYGLGFAAMAGVCAALFATAMVGPRRDHARADVGVQLILAAAGLASALLASWPRTAPYAAWTYAAIGPAIGVLTWALSRARRPATAGRGEPLASPAAAE